MEKDSNAAYRELAEEMGATFAEEVGFIDTSMGELVKVIEFASGDTSSKILYDALSAPQIANALLRQVQAIPRLSTMKGEDFLELREKTRNSLEQDPIQVIGSSFKPLESGKFLLTLNCGLFFLPLELDANAVSQFLDGIADMPEHEECD